MSPEERAARRVRLQRSLRSIYDWMGEIFDVWSHVADGGVAPLSAADSWQRAR
jgi:hypothetical protein